jgi:hypothetical protein
MEVKEPPREFAVGVGEGIRLKDCARIALEPDEQVTFTTPSGAEYDVARKSWGFYATPSLNGRLTRFHLRGVLVKNGGGQFFILLVERGKELLFERYLEAGQLEIVTWLDGAGPLQDLEQRVKGG